MTVDELIAALKIVQQDGLGKAQVEVRNAAGDMDVANVVSVAKGFREADIVTIET
jgi:hypothetical protein